MSDTVNSMSGVVYCVNILNGGVFSTTKGDPACTYNYIVTISSSFTDLPPNMPARLRVIDGCPCTSLLVKRINDSRRGMVSCKRASETIAALEAKRIRICNEF